MKQGFLYILLLFGASNLCSQEAGEQRLGTVSFVTSNNVYVKFESTQAIVIGDTLQFNGVPCLLINEKSSTSVVSTLLNDCSVKKNDVVSYTLPKKKITPTLPDETISEPRPTRVPPRQKETETNEEAAAYSENIRGRITLASYNTFSNIREDRNRLQTRFNMDALHIGDSKFSFETDLAYRHVMLPSESNYRGRTSIFNIYILKARFDATPDFSLTLGRTLNNKISTVGAVDGIQAEKYFGSFYVGALAGFRPDFFDYGFNGDLFQYGGYIGVETDSENFYSQTTAGAMEQTNAGASDRRYLYLQHNSTIDSNLNFFGSAELDIFGKNENTTRLTNLYISARYRFSRSVNAMISYDSRKRIIYYETFQNELDRLLDDDLARQGLRARLNLRPFKRILFGGSYSRRFQSDSQNASDNLYGYVTLTKIPGVDGRLNVSYNNNQSNYLTSNVLAVRHSRNFFKDQLNADFYYRMADYEYGTRNTEYTQNFYGTSLSYSFSRTWQISMSSEFSKFEDENNIRIYGRLTKRFFSKRK